MHLHMSRLFFSSVALDVYKRQPVVQQVQVISLQRIKAEQTIGEKSKK